MAAAGITLVQQFTYRGNDEEWTNQYHFVGDAPSDETGWLALLTSLVGLVRPMLGGSNTIVRAYCYEDTDDDSVLTIVLADHSITGTGEQNAGAGEFEAPGDAAAWVRWKTARVNTHGKPIYLRKYYHGIILAPAGGDSDNIADHVKTAMTTFGSAVNASVDDWPGIAGPDGVAPGLSTASSFVTTRTLKRRGKRPS